MSDPYGWLRSSEEKEDSDAYTHVSGGEDTSELDDHVADYLLSTETFTG